MSLITEFIEKVFTENSSFNIKEDDREHHFIKDQVGKATYIYIIRSWGDVHDCARILNNPTLAAIVAEGTIYIVNEYSLGVASCYRQDDTLPEHIVYFSQARAKSLAYMRQELLPIYYASLETEELSDEETISTGHTAKHYCREIAREGFFSETDTETFIKNKIQNTLSLYLSEDDFAFSLCGFTTIEELAKEQFEENKERWKEEKALNEKIRFYLNSPDTVKEWELVMAKSICVDAKNITVEFEKDGYSFTGKIEPYRVRKHLIKEETFASYNFSGTRAENAGANFARYTCEDIVKISYGKKVLYTSINKT